MTCGPLDWLQPRPDPVVRTVEAAVLGGTAFDALRRDGVVRVVRGGLAVSADAEPTPQDRALALGQDVPGRAVVGRATAAWVHAGGPPPARLELLVPPGRRRLAPDPGRRTHEAELPADDVLAIAGIRVTSVQRTGLDVARFHPPAEALPMLHALVGCGLDAHAARDRLAGLAGDRGTLVARSTLTAVLEGRSVAASRPPRRHGSARERVLLGRAGAGHAVDVEDALHLADRREHRRQV